MAMEEGWSIKYLSREMEDDDVVVVGCGPTLFSPQSSRGVEIKSPNFAKGDMHQGVEIKIIYEFLSA